MGYYGAWREREGRIPICYLIMYREVPQSGTFSASQRTQIPGRDDQEDTATHPLIAT
jgi:hypothetical protein